MYQRELEALKRANRFRKREIFDEDNLIDFASNDYLGLAYDKKQFKKAVKMVSQYDRFAPKASALVNGYHPIHEGFERSIAFLNGFEKGLIVGSGFLANITMIEALVRKKDILFIDEEYHASGVLATKLIDAKVVTFRHNNPNDLEDKLKEHNSRGRKIIAVEGVYSMSGELCNKDIFELSDRYNTLLIVDEAHSSGVIGGTLLGIFEHYNITPQENHIKMGTLGKAYGSYGAYILGSNEIISFLENRGKPIIYATAPSIFDTALALVNIEMISNNSQEIKKEIKKRQKIVKKILDIELESLILPISVPSNEMAIKLQKALMVKKGFLVGAIRQPTVSKPILRIIPRVQTSKKALKSLLNHF
jgi:8-amino-7-oxononanoate synthase